MISFLHYLREMSELDEMPLPDSWDKNIFTLPGRISPKNFRQALEYARKNSTYVAKGSSRAVFRLTYEGRQTMLKLAMNEAGLSQNEREVDVIFDGVMGHSRVVIPGIDYDKHNDEPMWIHEEYATRATGKMFVNTLGGRGLLDLYDYIYRLHKDSSAEAKQAVAADFNTDHELVHETYELWGNLGFEREFLADIEGLRNWGKYQGRLVLVDLGLSSEVYRRHYNTRRPTTPRGWIKPKP